MCRCSTWGTWFICECGSARLTVGLSDLKDLLQPKGFCDFIIFPECLLFVLLQYPNFVSFSWWHSLPSVGGLLGPGVLHTGVVVYISCVSSGSKENYHKRYISKIIIKFGQHVGWCALSRRVIAFIDSESPRKPSCLYLMICQCNVQILSYFLFIGASVW